MGDSRAILRSWWRDPAHYGWFVRTLESHSGLRLIKAIIGAGGALMFVINMLIWMSPAGPTGTVGRTIFAAAGATAAVWTIRWWLFPWPRAMTSVTMLTWADLAITASCLVDSDRVYGALSAMLLVVTGSYITFFHSPKALAAHAGWSLLTVGVLAVLLVADAESNDLALAGAMVLIMVAAIVVVLPALQFCYWVLRIDVLSDPLTLLLNRRGLDYYLHRPRYQQHMCVIALDLDSFKTVNDTFGHTIGDEVLVSTAERLRAAADPDALVARTGGEEFAVVDQLDRAAALGLGERLRRAVAESPGIPVTVTVSVGVAVCDGGTDAGRPQLLLRCADNAMYRAKRLGGNTVVLAEDPEQPMIQLAEPTREMVRRTE
ncbi:GGDEF domain-containing protein [Nocardia sp. NPDC052112]|uniref:GGDEF domain-containing protein n=1 Tax=Nocardia sp. NPDC052112 TaxID=3155646 RepID=UPI00344A8D98